jgi:hypothetical protein
MLFHELTDLIHSFLVTDRYEGEGVDGYGASLVGGRRYSLIDTHTHPISMSSVLKKYI